MGDVVGMDEARRRERRRRTAGRAAEAPDAIIQGLARVHDTQCMDALASIMNDGEAPADARVRAAVAILDRGWGPPPYEGG